MNNKAVILEKNGEFGVISIDDTGEYDILGQYDTRNKMIFRTKIENTVQSDKEFDDAIKTSVKRGWNIVYFGERLVG